MGDKLTVFLNTCVSVCRMWDVDKEENFVLNLDNQPGYERSENINCVAFCDKKSRSSHYY